MGFNQQQHSGSHGHHSAAADGVSQRVNSPRFSGPMTRRAQSFKRSNGGQSGSHKNSSSHNHHHHEIDLHLCSPRSELAYSEGSADGFESVVEKKQTHHHRVTQRLRIKRLIEFGSGGGLEWGLREKKKLGHWMFFLFCGMCLFLGILKICANGWFGSTIERAGFDQVSSFPAMKLNI